MALCRVWKPEKSWPSFAKMRSSISELPPCLAGRLRRSATAAPQCRRREGQRRPLTPGCQLTPPADTQSVRSALGIWYHTYHQRPHEAFQGPILVIDHKPQVCLRHPYAADLNCGRHWQCGKNAGDGLLAMPGFVKGGSYQPPGKLSKVAGPLHNVVVRLVALSANTRATGPSLAMRSYFDCRREAVKKAHPIEMTVPSAVAGGCP